MSRHRSLARLSPIALSESLIMILLLLTAVGPARSQQSPANPEAPAENTATALNSDTGPAEDAGIYASRFGLTEARAKERLALQREAGALEAELAEEEPETFAVLYIRQQPSFAVVARFTRDARSTLTPHAAGTPLAAVVVAEVAKTSLKTLRSLQAGARGAAASAATPADSSVDVKDNRVQLRVENAPAAPSPLTALVKDAHDHVAATEGDLAMRPARSASGGQKVRTRSGRHYCTTGFAVRNRSGKPGVTTAAHCPQRLYLGNKRLPFHSQRLYGSYDAQWSATPHMRPAPRERDGSGYRRIRGGVSWGSQEVGSWVCKYGARTHLTFGNMSDKWYAPAYVPHANATFVGVSSPRPVVRPGDSGAPFFAGNHAYGTATAYSRSGSTYYGYYMAVNYLSGMGLRLVRT